MPLTRPFRARRTARLGAVALLAGGALALLVPSAAQAAPTSVTLVGSLQSELGCSGDLVFNCPQTALTHDVGDDVWSKTFSLPAGSYAYKMVLDTDPAQNYGAGGVLGGTEIALTLAATTDVTFYYDPLTHWATDNHNSAIVTLPGNFQSELGCPADFDPSCLRSWLKDVDGDGIYTKTTDALPAGDYSTVVTLDQSFANMYGAGGIKDGDNIDFTVPAGATVTFSYDAETHLLTITNDSPNSTSTPTPTPATTAATGESLATTGTNTPIVAAIVGAAVLIIGLALVLLGRRRRS